MRRRFYTLDVFTDTKLAGNPLAVVLDSEGLDTALMQKIAREFNLSETVFCAPPRDPVNTAALRIFTPAAEMPFAGHPTVGTAVLLAKLQASDLLAREDVGLVLEEAIGPVTCAVRHRKGEAPHARFEIPQLPSEMGPAPAAATLAAQLAVPEADIGFESHRPVHFSAGNPIIFVPLASIETLGRATLGGATVSDATGEPTIYYLYTPGPDGAIRSFRSRMLSVGYGVPEDPATGSAAAAFAGAWRKNELLADGSHECLLLQGVEMGRPSRIGLAFTVEDAQVVSAAIGGFAVVLAEGTFDL